MSPIQTALLGAIAGFTIFLGLPLGRMKSVSPRVRGFLSVMSAGILLFIFWDVLTAAHDAVEGSLLAAQGGASWSTFVLDLFMAVGGLAVGTLGLAWLERKVAPSGPPAPILGASQEAPALTTATQIQDLAEAERRKKVLSLGMMIALAIGLHNFSEGLAIGVSARAGAVGLAGTLILGFALHNATEGFGIVGPLGDVRPSWSWLFVAGLVGGGPTFLGTLVGYHVSSEPLELAFFTLAAGGILYVVGQIWGSAQRKFSTAFVLTGLVVGFTLGLVSDLVITAGGG
jgi:ZIP family zinc transporter